MKPYLRAVYGSLIPLVAALSLTGCDRGAPAPVLLDKGRTKLAAGDAGVASVYLEKAVENAPEHAPAWMHRGAAYWQLKRPGDAARCFERAGDLLPRDSRPLAYLAQMQAEQELWPDARVTVERALKATSTPWLETMAGRIAIAGGAPDTAIVHLERALELDSAYAPALFNLAVTHERFRSDTDTARNFYGQYLATAPDGAMAALARTALRDPSNEPATNTEQANAADDASPGRDVAVASDASAADDTEPPPTIVASTPVTTTSTSTTTSTTRPRVPVIDAEASKRAFNQGLRCFQTGAWSDAIHYYGLAVRKNPAYVKAHYNLGLAHVSSGDRESAKAAFARALELDPQKQNARYMLGNVCWELRDYAAAKRHLSQVLEVSPRHEDANFILGHIATEERDRVRARRHFETCLRVAPDGRHAAAVRRWLERNP